MNYIYQSPSLAARWMVGSAMHPMWFPTHCWLQAHPLCRLGGFVPCSGCLWQPIQTAQMRRGSAGLREQCLSWHRNLLWPPGFAGGVLIKARGDSGFWIPAQHMWCALRWFWIGVCFWACPRKGTNLQETRKGWIPKASWLSFCHLCRDGEGRGVSIPSRPYSFVGCCFSQWVCKQGPVLGTRQETGLLPSLFITAWRKDWEIWPNTPGVLAGHKQRYISPEIMAAWALLP